MLLLSSELIPGAHSNYNSDADDWVGGWREVEYGGFGDGGVG